MECGVCGGQNGRWPGKFEDHFDLPEGHLLWNDGPLAGVAVCRASGSEFAFQSIARQGHRWMEWRLIRIGERNPDSEACDYVAEAGLVREWLQVDDDQREGMAAACTANWRYSVEHPLEWTPWS